MKLLKTLILAIVCSNALLAQQVYEDFENNTAKLAWKAENGTYTLENDPVNNQKKVGAYTKSSSHAYSLFQVEIPNGIDLTQSNQFRISVYSENKRPFIFKLEGPSGTAKKVVHITKTNTWHTYTIDFSEWSSLAGFNKIILFFDPASNRGEKFYFDDIVSYTTHELSTIKKTHPLNKSGYLIDNFELSPKSWTANGGIYTKVSNPNKKNPNTSLNCGKFLKTQGPPLTDLTWVSYDISAIDFQGRNELNIKVLLKDRQRDKPNAKLVVKLEGASSGIKQIERRTEIRGYNQWHSYAFDFSNVNLNDFTQLNIFFGTDAVTHSGSYYFDDVLVTAPRSYQEDTTRTLDQLRRSSYELFRLSRSENGMYLDKKNVLNNDDAHSGSIAAVGMGLVALCIGHNNGWENDAADKVIRTLETAAGHTPGFKLSRNTIGFATHYFDMNTGQRAIGSEYTIIDTGIFMSGALFAKEYFSKANIHNRATDEQKTKISNLVLELWNTVKWEDAISNLSIGEISLRSSAEGVGSGGSQAFSEYIIAADLAKRTSGATGTLFWNTFYRNSNNLRKAPYTYTAPDGTTTITPTLAFDSKHIHSSFLIQFAHYLVNGFNSNPDLNRYLKNAKLADKNWWKSISEGTTNNPIPRQSYEWGCGAGETNIGYGYHADKVYSNNEEQNWSKIVSPHIISGFLPADANKEIENDLLNLYKSGRGLQKLDNIEKSEIIWRYSKEELNWKPNVIQLVDFSTILFGLQHLKDTMFFKNYTKYSDMNYNFSGLICKNYLPWNENHTYVKNQLVNYKGTNGVTKIYVSLQNGTNKNPETNSLYWKLIDTCSSTFKLNCANYREYGTEGATGDYPKDHVVKKETFSNSGVWELYQAKWVISKASPDSYNIPNKNTQNAWRFLEVCSNTSSSAKKAMNPLIKNKNSLFIVSPNPASNIISIKGNTGITSVEIYSIQGHKVLTSDSKTIDISGLINGLYILKLHTKDGVVETFKIMKE